MECEILYNSNKRGRLRINIISYLRKNDFEQFKSQFMRGDIPQKIRYTLEITDDMKDIQKSAIQFYKDFLAYIDTLIIERPDDENKLIELRDLVKNELFIDVDNTQSASIDSDLELKTQDEVYDKNRANLEKHLQEIYGLESYQILMSIKQDFYDLIIGAAYYDSKTETPVDIDNDILNKNIKQLKENLLNNIKQYLDSQNIPYKNSARGIQDAFYTHIKSLDNFKQTLNSLQADKTKQSDKQDKINLFKELLFRLEGNVDFQKKVLSKLNKYQKTRLNQNLYSGDCYSSDYLLVREYIKKTNDPELNSIIEKIESPDVNLLEATNAYSILTHFDEMLIERLGKQISIQEGTEGVEVDGKYSYHQDTAHERKDWQTSEAVGSEKHTSKFTEAVFSQIRIFDHKTGEYKNRRLDSTSFIVAARHLIDDILYGNISINGSGQFVKDCAKLIKESTIKLHSSPQEKFQIILQLLFDTTEGLNKTPIKEYLSNKRLLTDHDLDILYSVYHKVFNKNNPDSFINHEIKGQVQNRLSSKLMQEVAAYVDSNITMDYLETSIDWETGEINLKVKKKYFNNAQLYKLRKSINSEINNKSQEKRQKLQDKYNMTVSEPAGNVTVYTVSIGDMKFELQSPNTIGAKILTSGNDKVHLKFADKSLFAELDNVDLIQYRQKLENGGMLSDNELKLQQVLQFIDDYLNLNISTSLGIQTLQVYQSCYQESRGMKYALMPLVQLAMRAAYINKQYLDAGEKSLKQYLEDDALFKYYKNNPKSKLFVETYGNVKYVAATFNDTVLDQWIDAFSMLTGQASKATTKDGQGNNIPNNSVGKLGGILHYYLDKQKETNCDSLMFVKKPNTIKSTFHDLEVSNIHGDTKSIKQFSCGELFFHSIFNKFWGNYNRTGNVIIQPTVYSDKTTFLNWEIETDLLDNPNYIDKVLIEYQESLGYFYQNVYDTTIDKLQKITDYYNQTRGTNFKIRDFLKYCNEKTLMEYVAEYNRQNPQSRIELEKDKDYRQGTKTVKITKEDGSEEIKTEKCCFINEILEYNVRVYNDKELLYQVLEHEKYNFLQNLIDYNTSFQVIDFGDSVEYYITPQINSKAKSKNAVITTILNYLTKSDDRINFFENWVDAKTGKLILAKQKGRNILGIGNDFNPKEEGLELNPFLDKFFYIEGLLSNNLRMSLTGSEINHPNKASNTVFNNVKNPKKVNDFVSFNKVTGELLQTKEEYDAINEIIQQCDNVSELLEKADTLSDPDIHEILQRIYDKSILKIINTAQGTQFKRNVIIPATLQYCQQNIKEGIPPKVKCAVIYDEKAPVHNYRGETGNVDSADGSAQITPFQSIMENLALGSQAVGFIKKPIWHSYDTNGGTAFLAKFATNTMTNESMRASLMSSTSLFKLFKRMTNLQWKEQIDLTKAIHMEKSISEDALGAVLYEQWVRKVLFQNQDLFYENKYGERVQIIMFNKTTTKDGKIYYYTKEKIGMKDPVNVYHMFDAESNHYTFDSYQKAKAFEEQNPGVNHTINSLFELHTALGSINCVDSTGKSSEFSNQVVVNFMNNVGNKRNEAPKNAIVNQTNYYQPLKKYHIGYALNNTAVKNGAKNINQAEAWKGNTELNYFEVDSDGLGMQMNADHDIVDSELTEFSQVIAATSAYGYTYDNCNEIFKGLAKTALQASKRIIDATDKFLERAPGAQSELYDAIGRIVLMERSIKDKESLTNIITEAVKKIFDKYKDHTEDNLKLPYSDSNIYSEFISSLASSITKASIKRKHPGSGCVMAPGYNMITYFEIGDKKYSHSDMLKHARNSFKEELKELAKSSSKYNPEKNTIDGIPLSFLSIEDLLQIPEVLTVIQQDKFISSTLSNSDVSMFNKALISRYLQKLQQEAPIFTDKSYFQPEDVVRVITPTGDLQQTIVLDTMEKYYDFKNRQDLQGTTYQVDILTPRNLKPSLIRWRYNPTSSLEELGVIQSEVYDKPWRDDPTKSNKAFTLSLVEDPTRKFEIVKDHEDGYWSIHFKTIPDGNTFESFTPLTEEQKTRLFKAAADAIPIGDKLSTWGSLTPGGISGINRFKSLGFKQVDTREVTDSNGNSIQIPILEKTGVYMNIFDLPVIKETFVQKGELNDDYRKQVQDTLHNLHDGFFILNDRRYEIIPGSLENTEAELVMSNIYKDIFGIENESLQTVLDQGEQFFVDQITTKLHAPKNTLYDLALLKDNGAHTLISFSAVSQNENCVENDFQNISVNEQDEIYCMKGNKPLFKIGKYVDITDAENQDLYIEDDTIVSRSGRRIDKSQYRIHKAKIQKRIDFVKRYKLTTVQVNPRTRQKFYKTNVLYELINKDKLVKLYGKEEDAYKQIGSLITAIYQQDNYKFIELNAMNDRKYANQLGTISSYLGLFISNNQINPDHRAYLKEQLNSVGKDNMFNVLSNMKKEYYKKEAHKKWVSFQDSLKFISSRIPAQTLQSFMTMKCVGWTENTKNMAYVSHFQIYLQGSDYDIDKAYIMGQSYDGNGIYIQWSPLFDYTSQATLSLSKQLPIPDPVKLIKIDNGIDVSEELSILINTLDDTLEPTSYENRIKSLKAYISILKKINKANGNINYSIQDSDKLIKIFNKINSHIYYKIPENVAEASYKNVASANIYAVSHDIRNRDQGYTAIAMDILQRAAAASPKGEQAATLNMLNPLTKYVMQYQNLVGKNVISIAANGEKVWFNAYYYWTKLLKENKTEYLQFQTTLHRIKGRSKVTLKTLSQLSSINPDGNTVKKLPDLNIRDIEIKNNLLISLGIDTSSEQYAYVDQLISQLLSAATDNAKELILAKINSGNNFARMYVYLIMTGYNFDDIVSFMISPVSEFIDSMSNSNMFSESELGNSPSKAINLARGIVQASSFLHGMITEFQINENTGQEDPKSTNKQKYVRVELQSNENYDKKVKRALNAINVDTSEEIKDLNIVMQGYILASLNDPSIDITTLINTNDTEINSYLQYCQNIAYKLRSVKAKYENLGEMLADVNEFKKIYQLSSEISSIASAWLGLNQGLPTDELSLLKRLSSMRKVIIDRERALEIDPSKMFTDSTNPEVIEKTQKYFNRVVSNILDNNSSLSEEDVRKALIAANDKGLLRTFDMYRYLTDEQYKKDMIKYNHIIKGTLNVLDMMEEIPHYKEIISCLKSLVVSKQTLSSKSRLINKLMEESGAEYLNDQQLRGIIRYVDKLNAVNFAKSLPEVIVLDKSIEGFNTYFEKVSVSEIDLSTFEGLATFKHWIEYEFLEDLKENYSDNPLVKHLQKVPENQREILATDIDLLNPNVTTVTRQSYDEILRGMAKFELEKNYKGTQYSIADLLQLYNILVNNNQYGSERLTTAFKACFDENNILNKYLRFIGEQDFDIDQLQDYELIDYYINAAPIVSTGAERFQTAKFIKVNDPVEGYILKRYNPTTNEYQQYQMIPSKAGNESRENTLLRLQNFAEYCPFEMPTMARMIEMFSAIDYDGKAPDDIISRIKNILIDFSNSGKLLIFKDC